MLGHCIPTTGCYTDDHLPYSLKHAQLMDIVLPSHLPKTARQAQFVLENYNLDC